MHLDRRTIRYVAAALAAAMAAIYYLIGVGVLIPVQPSVGDEGGLLFFGASAGSAFLLGAVLLIAFDRRALWILGVALQVFVVWGYFAVAPSRTPNFEIWGITLRIIQVPLIVALAYLAYRPPELAAPRTTRFR